MYRNLRSHFDRNIFNGLTKLKLKEFPQNSMNGIDGGRSVSFKRTAQQAMDGLTLSLGYMPYKKGAIFQSL
jgi:hypothetical protein